MVKFTSGDFNLKKRYCPNVGHNVPIIVCLKEGVEMCLCFKECDSIDKCEKYANFTEKTPSNK